MLLCALTVGKIAIGIYKNTKCPLDKDLKNAVLSGSGKKYDQIISHIGTCDLCQSKIDRINTN